MWHNSNFLSLNKHLIVLWRSHLSFWCRLQFCFYGWMTWREFREYSAVLCSNKHPKKDKVFFCSCKVAPRLDSSSLLTKKEPHCCVVIMLVAYPMQQNLHIVLVSMHFHKPPPPFPFCRPPSGHSISALARRRRVDPCPDVRPVSAAGSRFIFIAQLTTSSISWRFTQGHYPDRQIDSHLTSWQSRSPLHVYSVAGQTFATPARLLSTEPFSINLEPALNRGAFLWCIN